MAGGQAIAKYGPIVLGLAVFVVIMGSLFLVDWWTP